ncbi:MAG: hypothetical protein ACE1S7_07675 [Candidatus Tisiphia sp.]
MKLLGIIDLTKRWNYTKQGVHQKIKQDKNFPKSVAISNKNTRVLLLLIIPLLFLMMKKKGFVLI